jgi:hypothetical protein
VSLLRQVLLLVQFSALFWLLLQVEDTVDHRQLELVQWVEL